MNEQSSRSHAILQMTLRNPRGKLHGQMSFIDLAGSEKGSDTAENEKKTRMEGAVSFSPPAQSCCSRLCVKICGLHVHVSAERLDSAALHAKPFI